jgi:hypothetical protein
MRRGIQTATRNEAARMTRLPAAICAAALLALFSTCSDAPSDAPLTNRPPETSLSLMPDSTIAPTTSRLHIHWWGDDPDGFVAGFLISFDGNTWTYTAANDSVFTLTLSGSDTAFVFSVRAVDNQGNRRYDAAGPYGAEPFVDRNGNGRYDEGEPFTDLGLADPTPATLRFPVYNTPPRVEFVKGSNPPDTTFTVASFTWVGTDLDGDETIKEYLYALNDTLNAASWKVLPRSQTFITLSEKDGLRPGDNAFYLKAVDIAGASSPIIRMPEAAGTWFVRRPVNDLLIVDDYGSTDETNNYYRSVADTLLGGRFRGADVLDIKLGATSTKRGKNVPPYINPTFIETLKLFKYVIWYCDNNPTLDLAQISLPPYQQWGGKVVYTASFPESAVDPRGGITDFAPIDSMAPVPITFVPQNTLMNPDAESPGYPVLRRDTKGVPVAFIRSLSRKINAYNLYRFAEDSRWEGRPVVAVRSGDHRFVLFSVPLSRFDGDGTAGAALWTVFTQEFGVR